MEIGADCIIARFVCCEDWDQVWSKRGYKLSKSKAHKDAFITEGYARAIQKEQIILIKAMMKACNKHKLSKAQVKGWYFYVNGKWFDSENVPSYPK